MSSPALDRYGWWGRTDTRLPGSRRALILLFASVFVAGSLVLGLGQYSRKTIVAGVLEPEGGQIVLASPANATLERVFVRSGDRVVAGQTLAQLAPLHKTDLIHSPVVELDALRDSLASLRATLGSLDGDRQVLETAVIQQRQVLSQQIQLAQQERDNRARAVELGAADLSRLQTLAGEGLRSRQDQDTSELNHLRLVGDLQQAERDLANLQGQKLQLDLQFERDRTAIERQRNDVQTHIDQLTINLEQASSDLSFRIVASREGIVDSILTEAGRLVRAGDTIATLIRPEVPLRVLLFIRPADIGFVRSGEELLVSVDTFPMQEFGTLRARIIDVSGTAVTNSRFSALAALKDGERSYMAVARLETHQVQGYGHRWQLRPGMSCHAYLALERRSLAGWLLNPVFEGLQRNPNFLDRWSK